MSKKNRKAAASVSSLSELSAIAVIEPETVTPAETSETISGAETSAILSESETLPVTVAEAILSLRELPDADFFPVPVTAPVSNLAPRFTTVGARDAFGFGSDSEVSFLIREIRTGTYTRKTLLTAFLARFVPTGEESDTRRKKTSFSVFFSDVKRNFGTYYASRALPILADENGILSFDPVRLAVVEKAVSDGILPELKGLSPKRTPEKLRKVLDRFGVYYPEG
jgi:hypothetical protein